MPFERFLESDFTSAGNLKPFFGTRICLNLWHLVMRFYMIPCWRIYTGKSLGGPFGQSGYPVAGIYLPLKMEREVMHFFEKRE
jgi:hypothetical protein